MMAAIKYSNTAEKTIRQISEDGSYWRQELDDFVDIIKDRKVASFYETALTKRLIMVSIALCQRIVTNLRRNLMGPSRAMESLQRHLTRAVLS